MTRLRKVPLVIHREGLGLVILRKSCRLCVGCDMLIVHRDELEPLLAVRSRRPDAAHAPLDYLMLGTVEPSVWRKGSAGGVPLDEVLRHMADFTRHMQIEYTGGGWGPTR